MLVTLICRINLQLTIIDMSAGAFTNSKYAASYGAGDNIHPIRVQPETIEATGNAEDNDPPAGDINNPISVLSSKSRRSPGIHPRYVRLKVTGAPPAGYSETSVVRLICLNQAFYEAIAAKGTEVQYLGSAWQVIGFSPEFVT